MMSHDSEQRGIGGIGGLFRLVQRVVAAPDLAAASVCRIETYRRREVLSSRHRAVAAIRIRWMVPAAKPSAGSSKPRVMPRWT